MPDPAAGDGQWAVHLGSGGDDHRYQRAVSRAAPTVTTRANRWMLRPARPPGAADDGMPWDGGGESRRVTIEQAAILQSFPPGWPWQGGRTSQYQQAGNAFPPLLAAHVLAEATGLPARLGRQHGTQTAAPL